MPSRQHCIQEIRQQDGRFIFNCQTTIKIYREIEEIICEGTTVIQCSHVLIRQEGDSVDYSVTLPEKLEDTCKFFIIFSNNIKKRVWKPSKNFDETSLPEQFHFTNRFLNLKYIQDTKRIQDTRETSLSTIDPVLCKLTCDEDNILHISGYIFIPDTPNQSLHNSRLHVIKFREESICQSFDIKINTVNSEEKIFTIFTKADYFKFWRRHILTFECAIDLRKIIHFSGFFNLMIEYGDHIATLKNYYKGLIKKDHCYPIPSSFFRRVLFVPFCDDVVNTWRIDIYNVSLLDWIRLRLLFRNQKKTAIIKDANTWLIGEYNNTARDNGLHFFHYLRNAHPDINAYYVIYRDSPERGNLQGRNIVYYGTYKHFQLAAKAQTLVFSHCPNYLVPKLDTIVRYKDKYKSFHTIFLQHGIIATTASVLSIRKQLREYNKFVVSSTLEKKNICEHLGYDENEVIITGLARWDHLLAISQKSSNILIMPTWRNDLENVSETVFIQSEYYKFWNSFLSNDCLLTKIRENDITVNFFLHIGLARFAHCFNVPKEVTAVNGENVQKLLSTCGVLVTDYSSVAFDVLFQNKPVIFCPFDYEEMMKLRKGPKFIDYEKDLPGPICYDLKTAITKLIECIDDDYRIAPLFRTRKQKFFDHMDNHNCERIYHEINTSLELTALKTCK